MPPSSNNLAVDSGPSAQAAGEWWERDSFLSEVGGAAGPCPAVIDCTGRSRFLFFGPYRLLAPGRWRARVHLRVCEDAAGRPFQLQFGAEPHYSARDVLFDGPGEYEIEIEHEMTAEGLAQIRLWLTRATFHGEVVLMGAFVEPVRESAPPLRGPGAADV